MERTLDAAARCELPVGIWRARSLDRDRPVTLFPHPVQIEENQIATVWVHVPWSLEVRVRDTLTGEPISGATVQWTSDRGWVVGAQDTVSEWTRGPDAESSTDTEGRVRLENLSLEVGHLTVFHPSYRPAIVSMDGGGSPHHEPLQVALAPADGAEIALRFVLNDARARPAVGVRVFTTLGRLAHASDDEGRLSLPPWATAEPMLALTGGGIVPSTVRLSDAADRTVRLAAASLVTVDVEGGEAASGFLLVSGSGDERQGVEGDYDGVAYPEPVVPYTDGRARFTAPLGSLIDVLAVSSDGASAEGQILVDAESVHARIGRARDDILHLRLIDERGAPVSLVGGEHVEACYTLHQSVPLLSNAAGIVTVPAAEHLRSLSLRSPRFAPVDIRRAIRRLDAEQSDPDDETISVTLLPAAPAILRVVTPAGRPLPGVLVMLGHPGFVAPATGSARWTFGPPMYAATTGADGKARIPRVPRGEWLVETFIHPARRPGGLAESVEPCGLQRIWLTGDGQSEVDVVVVDVRHVQVVVFDASNGAPLQGFQITSYEACTGSYARLDGNTWTNWIPDSWSSLSVTATGYGSAEVPLGEEASYRVELWPGARGRLKVNGEATLAGLKVYVRVLQDTGRSMNQVWSSTVQLDQELEADFHLPVQDNVVVSLGMATVSSSGEVRFLPLYAPWADGGTVEFTAVEQP